jgi:cytochrome P450
MSKPVSVSTDPPQSAYFDSALRAWVLSRYEDALRAFREPALQQQESRAAGTSVKTDVRTQVLNALPQSSMAEWQRAMEALAREMVDRLPAGRSIDLVHELIQPWTLAVAVLILGANPTQSQWLKRVTRYRCAGERGVRQKLANLAFQIHFRKRAAEKSVFTGISETLAGFLANAWLALLQHPVEFARLRAQPELMPRAIEELLRYAGLVHSLSRRATAEVAVGGVTMGKGDLVILKLAEANRDPEHCPEPDRLDLTRRAGGHLALGVGPHSCAGAMLLRMAAAVITSALAQRCADVEFDGAVEWRRGSTLVSPESLTVVLRR